jgi:hypothetical protein
VRESGGVIEVVPRGSADCFLDSFSALAAVSKSFFFFVVDVFAEDDVFRALGAEDIAAEAAVVSPADDG